MPFLEFVYMRAFNDTLSLFATSELLLDVIAGEIALHDPLAERLSVYVWRTDMPYDLLDKSVGFLLEQGFELVTVTETGAHYFRRYSDTGETQ